ncbi:hypothetical protein A1OO_15320 [Enterovibrio norvegicus FF-33]|uniref:eCIS core domain-containing protein n=1 Tax=Enterovibrio norvegicus TaxID=188144 RepID=UPI0002E5592B|nr:DUF4157 domain-containing protein [Enterovibrio norvegicus]OEE67125.1 hypothetical protein A1OO_15320 [Enterovibrio norvegicus FF-33]
MNEFANPSLHAVKDQPAPAPFQMSRQSPVLQRKCSCGNTATQGAPCSACGAKAPMSAQSSAAFAGSGVSMTKPPMSTNSQQPDGHLPEALRQRAEKTFGAEFPEAKLYTGGVAQRYARQLQAKAFTAGSDVYFGSGFYNPDSQQGLALIGHELTHVVQQRRGLSFAKLNGSNDAYEQEADRGGDAFAAGKSFQLSTPSGSIGRWTQKADAGESASAVGVADPSHQLDFLGEFWDPEELEGILDELSMLEDENHRLLLVPESSVQNVGSSSPAPRSASTPPAAQIASPSTPAAPITSGPIAQTKALDGASTTSLGERSGLPFIQRATVAGCNVPALSANQIGIQAHMQIGGFCGAMHTMMSTSCLGGGHPGFQIPGATRPDMVIQYPAGPFIDEVGEIKPASWLNPLNNRQAIAEAQLNRDIASYQAIIGPATSMSSFAFPRMTFVGNPLQNISVWPRTGGATSNGVYYYRCTNKPRRRPRPIPIVIPNPVPVVKPVPHTVPRTAPHTVTPQAVAGAAATVGLGYLIYRGIRMIPSLAPPLWWTVPGNLALP